MKSKLKFSIIVPCFNAGQTLHYCLESVVQQTYENFELIAVNDGSSDDTPEILDDFAKKIPGMTILHQKNKGLGESRNAALGLATGEYVLFLDADDFWCPSKLEQIFESLQSIDCDLLCHNEWAVIPFEKKFKKLRVLQHGPFKSFENLLIYGNSLSPSAVAVKLSVIKSVGFFSTDKKLHGCEDWDLWIKLAENGAKFEYVDKVLGSYVLHENNMSNEGTFYERSYHVFQSAAGRGSKNGVQKNKIDAARQFILIQLRWKVFLRELSLCNLSALFVSFISTLWCPFFWKVLSVRALKRYGFLSNSKIQWLTGI